MTCRVQKVERSWFRRRHTSECWTEDGLDVGECMIRAGWATDYSCFSDGYYRDLETEAKNKGLGPLAMRQRPDHASLGAPGTQREVRNAHLPAERSWAEVIAASACRTPVQRDLARADA